MKLLFVEPEREKSWGHNQFVKLLKIASYHYNPEDEVAYIISPNIAPWKPDMIYSTSLFTYWYQSVWDE